MATNHIPRLKIIKIDLSRPRPVRFDWLEKACSIPGKALSLSVGLWRLASIYKTPAVRLTRNAMARACVSRYAATDALRRLEDAGLIIVERRQGRSPMVTLVEPGTSTPIRMAIES